MKILFLCFTSVLYHVLLSKNGNSFNLNRDFQSNSQIKFPYVNATNYDFTYLLLFDDATGNYVVIINNV